MGPRERVYVHEAHWGLSLLPCSIGQSKSQDQPRSKERGNRFHLLVEVAAKPYCKNMDSGRGRKCGHFVNNLPQGIYLSVYLQSQRKLAAHSLLQELNIIAISWLGSALRVAPFSGMFFCHNSKTMKGTSYCSPHSFTPTEKSQHLSVTAGLSLAGIGSHGHPWTDHWREGEGEC